MSARGHGVRRPEAPLWMWSILRGGRSSPRAPARTCIWDHISTWWARGPRRSLSRRLWTLPAHASRRPHSDVSTSPHAPPRATQIVDKNMCVVTRVRTRGRRAEREDRHRVHEAEIERIRHVREREASAPPSMVEVRARVFLLNISSSSTGCK